MKNKNVLHNLLNDVLAKANVRISDLEGVAVAIGPGSFTGLRVGLASAKGICWPLNLPLVGVSSLLAVAKCARISEGEFTVIKDAKRNEFYYAGFRRDGDSLKQLIPDSVGLAEDMIGLMGKGFVAIGPGVDELKKYAAWPSDLIDGYDRHGIGGAIALAGIEMLSRGETLDLAASAPNYIRAPKAKEWKP
jgi:tRNA threonylcarbamoyladenosine biosynthesis protein TsaB